MSIRAAEVLAAYRAELERRQRETHGAQLLRGEDADDELPQSALNVIWENVITSEMMTSRDAEALAAGLAPDRLVPVERREMELYKQLKELTGNWVETFSGHRNETPEEEAERLEQLDRVKHEIADIQQELDMMKYLRQSPDFQSVMRKQLAGIPEVARVLATSGKLWRHWWLTEFPCQSAECPPGIPSWIDVQRTQFYNTDAEGPLADSMAGLEAQYAHNRWRRYHAWTGFFERRCYHLIMDLAGTRCADFNPRPVRYLPPGVIQRPPVKPSMWRLQPVEDRVPGQAYFADIEYSDDVKGAPDDVDLEVCALLGERVDDVAVSAPLLAYFMMQHWHMRYVPDTGIAGIMIDYAAMESTDPHTGDRYDFNFIDDLRTPLLRSGAERATRYVRILTSYILWYRHETLANNEVAAIAATVADRAEALGFPLRRNMLEPLEEAQQRGLYDPVEKRWPYLDALPVVPTRGHHGSMNIVQGMGGVRFMGEHLVC